MATTLHITNGDILASRLQTLGFSTVLPWREMLNEGKVPAYSLLQGALVYQEVNHERAIFISSEGSSQYTEVLDTLNTQTGKLLNTDAEAIVLWFESDVYDMLLLSQICFILSTIGRNNSTVFLLQTQQHIHKIADSELKNMYENRIPMSSDYFQQVCKFWDVFTTAQPDALRDWVTASENSELQAIRDMATDIKKYFLTLHNGLSGIEALVQKHPENYSALLAELGDRNFVADNVFVRINKRLLNLEECTDRYFGAHWIDDILQ